MRVIKVTNNARLGKFAESNVKPFLFFSVVYTNLLKLTTYSLKIATAAEGRIQLLD